MDFSKKYLKKIHLFLNNGISGYLNRNERNKILSTKKLILLLSYAFYIFNFIFSLNNEYNLDKKIIHL